MRALVVDDSKTMCTIMSRHLHDLGFEVHSARTGTEGLATLNRVGTFELVMIDWNMPEMDGFELLQRIRADSRFDETRLMMVTTESEMANVAIALEAGANEYLMKPFDRDALLEKLLLLGFDPSELAA